MNTYKINSVNKGFYKVTRPDGIIHNMSEKTVRRLKEDKENKFVEVKIIESPTIIDPKDDDLIPEADQSKKLMQLSKNDLAELAQRNGFTDEITNDVTKAMLVEFIISKDNS